MTQVEPFPTVVICPKQTKSYIDEWGFVKVALKMIEFTCNNSNPEILPDRCSFYDSMTKNLKMKAGEVLNESSISSLPLSHTVMMAAIKGITDLNFPHFQARRYRKFE